MQIIKLFKLTLFGYALLLVCCSNYYMSKKIDVENDVLLKELKKSLPDEFIMQTSGDSIFIEKKDSVWILYGNKINAPIDNRTQSEKIREIKNIGKKTKAQLIFRCEKKWDKSKLTKAANHNDSINNIIGNLPDKYKIRKFFNSPTKPDDSFFGQDKTSDDQKNIDLYKKEKGLLNSKWIIIPDYQSEKYALFLLNEIGVDDDFHTVFPFDTSEKIYEIHKLFNKIITVK